MVKAAALRVLVLCDDIWHPAATVRAGLMPLAGADYAFDWIEHAHDWSAERMNTYPVVLLAKSNNVSGTDETAWVDDIVANAFVAYVRAGHGLLAIHSGSAGYQGQSVLRGLLGGVFAHHPPQCAVTVTPEAGHPLCAGATSFTVTDEHYHMLFDDPAAEVFVRTRSEHGEQPGGWTRREGAGRVCLLTPGHNLDVWLQPDYQTLIANGLRWCGGLA